MACISRIGTASNELRPPTAGRDSGAAGTESDETLHQVGAVVVQHQGRAIGIVTDRDLTVRVIGHGLEPQTTTLATVMTKGVVTLPLDASRTEALRLMQERRIRRIPLVEDDAVVGVATLDDLLADEAAPLEDFADVVRAQIGDGGPMAPTRLEMQAARRRASRLDASYRRLMNEVLTESALPSIEEVDEALIALLIGAMNANDHVVDALLVKNRL